MSRYSLGVLGALPDQYVGLAPDLTGVSVRVYDSKSGADWPTTAYEAYPAIWTQPGEQTLTLTYTDTDIPVEPFTGTVTVLESSKNEVKLTNIELYEYWEAPEAGYNVTFPSSFSGTNISHLKFTFNSEPTVYTTSQLAGQTITGIETINCAVDNNYHIYSVSISADNSFGWHYNNGSADYNGSGTSWENSSWPGGKGSPEAVSGFDLTLSNNTTFSSFGGFLDSGPI